MYMPHDDVLQLLWAKSDACGSPHSLIGHLLDTAAVAEIIWDEFMAPITKQLLDDACDGRGRQVFVLICALHDIGKATPEFQRKCPQLAAPLADSLPIRLRASDPDKKWHHTRSGAWLLMNLLNTESPELAASRAPWAESIILGHHGKIIDLPHSRPSRQQRAEQEWEPTQKALVDLIVRETGIPLSVLITQTPPSPSLQLQLCGYVVMADWIASSSEFPGIGLRSEDAEEARQRARQAWQHLGFTSGWQPSELASDLAAFRDQFGFDPRPLQQLAAEAALDMPKPGLIIIEAPMGEGKTEAGEFASEILARRFGCDGFVFAMPTQGTTDTMYERVAEWNKRLRPDMPVALLHGKAMLNEHWLKVLHQDAAELSDIYDDDDVYGPSSQQTTRQPCVPAAWLLGRHRQLLSPLIVGTVDQVLRAAVRSKYVMLRHAGLAGKVLIIDEVHSYDVYMSVFLHELLRWCAGAGIPVILMSATLPPDLRDGLIAAYTPGHAAIEPSDRYPIITSVSPDGTVSQRSCLPFRQDSAISVEVLSADDPGDLTPLVDNIDQESSQGGCLLVIVNTVRRAQQVYQQLQERGIPTRILHGRLATGARADRTADLVDLLGKDRHRGSGRPERLVVVATQIAEQSFDVDADLLFTDLAPADLLLQRIGRLHRHDRPEEDRPLSMRTPRAIITGLNFTSSNEPSWPKPFEYIYARWTLLAAAYQLSAENTAWTIPSSIPRIVAEAYGSAWEDTSGWPSVVAARADLRSDESRRTGKAGTFRLGDNLIPGRRTLEGIHFQSAAETDKHPVVRDGEPTREVCLVVRDKDGYLSLDGHPLGPNGERCCDPNLARRVLGDCVRVRESENLGDVQPLPAWANIPLLAWQDALVLDTHKRAWTKESTIHYDDQLGLVINRLDR